MFYDVIKGLKFGFPLINLVRPGILEKFLVK
jgi:hypothetical protein